VVRAGALASIGAALPGGFFGAPSKLPAITKTIPSTGEKLPVMGVGTEFACALLQTTREPLAQVWSLARGKCIDDTEICAPLRFGRA
jgi:hypothetical protein